MKKDLVNVRYMVEDVDAAIEFYTTHLGFILGINSSPAFADVTRGNLRLLLSGRKCRFDAVGIRVNKYLRELSASVVLQ